jgi:uncharacterized protein involved in response to NO
MAIGLYRMAFLLMLERTLTQFMKGLFQVEVLRKPWLDGAIKLLGLALVFQAWLPVLPAALLLGLLAALLAVRFVGWRPDLGFTRIDLAVMFLGYLAIVAQLLVEAAGLLGAGAWVGSVSVHLFTVGVMGLIIPAMFVRISKGHTGRKVVFDAGDKLVLWIMLTALVLRVVLPQLCRRPTGAGCTCRRGHGSWASASSACACCRASSPRASTARSIEPGA